MKTLEELSHDSFYNMDKYNQITIDYIEEVEEAFMSLGFREGFDRQDQKQELQAINYRISTIIDIISPALETDVNAFFSLSEIINKYLENEK